MRSLRKTNQPQKGQSLVEFVLVLGLLLVIAAGAIDLGRVFHSMIVITNSAREAARYLSLHPEDKGSSYGGTIAAAIQEAQGSMVSVTGSDVIITTCADTDALSGCDSGTGVIVTVTVPFQSLLGWIIPLPTSLSRSAEMMVP